MARRTAVFCNNLLTNSAVCVLVVPAQVLRLESWWSCSCHRDQLQRDGHLPPRPLVPGGPQVQHLCLPQLWLPFQPPSWPKVPSWPPPWGSTASHAASGQVSRRLASGLRRRPGIVSELSPAHAQAHSRSSAAPSDFTWKKPSSKVRLFPDKATAHQTSREALVSSRCCAAALDSQKASFVCGQNYLEIRSDLNCWRNLLLRCRWDRRDMNRL